jgi:hypothetical protein
MLSLYSQVSPMKNYDRLWSTLADSRIALLNQRIQSITRHNRPIANKAVPSPPGISEPVLPSDRLPPSLPIVHRFPRIPLMLDGDLLEKPEDLTAYNGQPLYYTPVRNDSGVTLAAFTSRDQMFVEAKAICDRFSDSPVETLSKNLSQSVARSQSEHICQQPPDNLPEQVCFFSDIHENGDVICLDPNRAYPDLTGVGRTKVMWWYTTDWNDVISSVSWCRWDISLYEHTHYSGSQLWLPAGCNTPNLVELGWNDRASSVVNWGQRF